MNGVRNMDIGSNFNLKINNKMESCAICDKELTTDDIQSMRNSDTILTCREHNMYGGYRLKELAKIRAGIIDYYPDSLKKCSICHSDLNQNDMDLMGTDSVIPTCEKHRMAHNWLQIELSKDWFKYCDFVGFDLNDSASNFNKFIQWRFNKYK